MAKKQITARVDEEILERLNKHINKKRNECSMFKINTATVIRHALELYLDKYYG